MDVDGADLGIVAERKTPLDIERLVRVEQFHPQNLKLIVAVLDGRLRAGRGLPLDALRAERQRRQVQLLMIGVEDHASGCVELARAGGGLARGLLRLTSR